MTTPLPYLDHLNPEQKDAVENLDGPTLVLAGAGTGKTRVLTARLAHMLHTGKAFPGQILSVTFTNKAAQEMKERVSELLGGHPVDGWWLGTFHSLSSRMLRRHADLVGLKSNFTILDTDDQIRLIKQVMELANVDPKKWTPRLILSMIDKWKDKGKTPNMVDASEAGEIAGGKMLRLYTDYQNRLKTLNACDFGDLLLHMITIFKNPAHKAVLDDYHQRFKYFLVDEYQDTNVAQYLWLRLLAQNSENICCVGDDDQSIYGWRGAEIENILRFEKDYVQAKTVRLEQNYRSTNNILSAANGVIAHNTNRLGKKLWSAQEDGDKIKLKSLWDGRQEAETVANDILDLKGQGHKLNDIAILIRASAQTREFEERFMTIGLPYRVIGGPRFYERMEIRDALAYLRVVVQPDDDLAFERIVNKPKRGLGPATINVLHSLARARNIPLVEATLQVLETEDLKPKARNTLRQLMLNFDRWRGQLRDLNHTELAQIILDESGYTQMWQLDKSPEAPGRLENLKELVSAIAEFENIPNFLEHVSLVMESQNRTHDDMVTIMTLHGAKGLEFDTVFLPGWEEGVFPNQRSMDETGLAGLEEERRLAYVGITRAKKRATITHAANRQMYGSWVNSIPSRFISELPPEHIEMESQSGLYHGSSNSSGYGRQSRDDNNQRSFPSARRGKGSSLGYGVDSGGGIPSTRASGNGFQAGNKIFHEKFGNGVIISVEGDKLDIRFTHAGRKKVLDSFVKKA